MPERGLTDNDWITDHRSREGGVGLELGRAPVYAYAMISRDPCLGDRARRAGRVLTRLYDEALAPAGLTLTQFTLLRVLSAMERPSLSELAAETAHEKSGLWRTLRPLVRDGLIDAAADGRVQRLSLTDRGMMTLVRALPLWREAQARVERALGPRGGVLIDLLGEVEARVRAPLTPGYGL